MDMEVEAMELVLTPAQLWVMAWYQVRILLEMSVMSKLIFGFRLQGQLNIVLTWFIAVSLFLSTESMVRGAGGSNVVVEDVVQDGGGTCRLSSVEMARLVQSWNWSQWVLVQLPLPVPLGGEG